MTFIDCTIHRGMLIKMLDMVKPAIAVKTVLPVLAYAKMVVTSTEIRVFGISLADISIEIVVPCGKDTGITVDSPGTVLVPHKILSDLLDLVDAPTIRIQTRGSVKQPTLVVSGFGEGETEYPTTDIEDFPSYTLTKRPHSIEVSPSIFIPMTKRIAGAAADDLTRPLLGGIYVQLKTEALVLAATNSYILMEETIPVLEPVDTELNIIVPAQPFSRSVGLFADSEDAIQIAMWMEKLGHHDDLRPRIQLQGTIGSIQVIVQCRDLEGNYPNYLRIKVSNADYQVEVRADHLSRLLRRGNLCGSDSHNMRCVFVALLPGLDRVAVAADSGSDRGRFLEQTTAVFHAVPNHGKARIVPIQAALLMQAIDACACDTVVIQVWEGETSKGVRVDPTQGPSALNIWSIVMPITKPTIPKALAILIESHNGIEKKADEVSAQADLIEA